MFAHEVKVYSAAKHSSAPDLPLREELNTFAIECIIYEPSKKPELVNKTHKNKKGRSSRKKHRRRAQKRRRKRVLWPFQTLFAGEKNYSDANSHEVNSTTSSLTMSTAIPMLESDTESSEIPSIMFTDNEMESDSEVDDMTVSTFALLGNASASPEVIYTRANDDSSTKWWYETSTPLKDDSIANDYSCFQDINMFTVEMGSSFCCSGLQNIDLLDNHDLKFDVDYEEVAK